MAIDFCTSLAWNIGFAKKFIWVFAYSVMKNPNEIFGQPNTFCLYTPPLPYRRRWWHLTPVFLPGKSHGWRSLVGCSPWGREESDATERLCFHFSLSCIGEGNGNPLQCSCLESPRDGGAWWAAVYGVAQSRTWLKWLSSSSSLPPGDLPYPGTKPSSPAAPALQADSLTLSHWVSPVLHSKECYVANF